MVDKEAEADRVSKELAKYARYRRDNATKALRELTLTEHGRDFLWELLTLGKVGSTPFALDPHLHAFNSGELNVGLQIQARIIEAEPAGYFRLLEDQINAERVRNQIATGQYQSEDTDD